MSASSQNLIVGLLTRIAEESASFFKTPAAALPSLTGAAEAFAALAFAGVCSQTPRPPLIVVTEGLPKAEQLVNDLQALIESLGLGTAQVYELPQETPDDSTLLGLWMKGLEALREASNFPKLPQIFVLPYAAFVGEAPCDVSIAATVSTNSPDEALALSQLVETLATAGYSRVPLVANEGEFAVRGSLVDVWSPGDEFPVRIEYFGEELESIRKFDPAGQRSIERITGARFLAVSSAESAHVPLVSLAPIGATLLALNHPDYPELTAEELQPFAHRLYTGDPAPRGSVPFPLTTVVLPGFAELAHERAHHPELFEAARRNLDTYLEKMRLKGCKIITLSDLSGGFEWPGATPEETYVVVTKSDRTWQKPSTRRMRRNHPTPSGQRINSADEIEPGEYVVHADFGIGRFIGVVTTENEGRRRECLKLEYAEGGVLYVPVETAHLLTRYIGVKGETVRLHALNGARWQKDREKAQAAVADLAAALLETQARRELSPGFASIVACDGLDAFEAAFPYEETPDQDSAIRAVKEDLARRRPMDRLICGDAGYGKTEVAMRAAFITAMNGRQTVVLAPTTVLAEQHFETFTARFEETPIRIECLTRFQTAAQKKATFERVQAGSCDIVIGTHAVLSSHLHFANLGLIIIDEEQRFGVKQKEHLKRLRTTADILTLSATPIPRTLYLAMTGARELSLLRTPPQARTAVETKIVRDSNEVIHAALAAELARGGQCFFLHNRVQSIGLVEKRLKAILPEARIITVHGQLETLELARRMRIFESGQADILLSTSIIEAGIDIPRANTIIIDRADTFGLAELYQLRGRVGRSSVTGRALLLLPPSGQIDSEARERLAALRRHGALGGGFNLAVRDLELRGAGDLLGSRQSGHIAAIGFTLYCQLLKRTIANLKGEKVAEFIETQLNIDFIDPYPDSDEADAATGIPYHYIEDDASRMTILKRLGELTDEKQLTQLRRELQDRFGRLPAPVLRLFRIAELRILFARAGFSRVDVVQGKVRVYKARSQYPEDIYNLPSKVHPDQLLKELKKSVLKRYLSAKSGLPI